MTATAHVKTFLSCGTDFKTRVLRLKPEVQILGSSKSIRHTKVEILRLKSCFLRKKETKLNANLWKAFSTELFCRRSWWFHVVLLNDLHLACKPRPRSSSARPAMPFVNQERLVLKFPTIYNHLLGSKSHFEQLAIQTDPSCYGRDRSLSVSVTS